MDEKYTKLQKEYKNYWHKFMAGVEIDYLPNPLILESWYRCKRYDVDPWQESAKEILNDKDLNVLKKNNAFLRETSIPMLQNIYEYFEGSGFNVVLSEANGYLIEVLGDEKVCNLSQQGKWMVGACWNEKSAGTNVIGMSIETGKPISLTGYECYCHYSHKWSGAGAPIKDANGKVIGAIGVAGLIGDYNPHTLGMITAVARAIEIQLAMKIAWNECALSEQQKSTIVDSINEGVILIDAKGKITLANQKIQRILNTSSDKIVGISIKNIFTEQFIKLLKEKNISIIDMQDEISLNNHNVRCFITCRHIMIDGQQKGAIIILNEVEHAKKLANQMLNNMASKTFADIIGTNKKFSEIVELARSVASMKINILLLGESGTGKDIFAQAIHNASPCRLGPFIALNCGAISKDLIISEIFGYSDGAFTGASRGGKPGKFEQANGGTLFLDEIGEMPLEQQKIFLRILDEKKVTRIGGQIKIPTNVRIIAATNKDIEYEIAMGRFRRDLYYRLNEFSLNIIPLRERKDDIEPLATEILKRVSREFGMYQVEITKDAWDLLVEYNWPGNIRELQNALRRAIVISKNQKITSSELHFLNTLKHKVAEDSIATIKNEINEYEAEILKNLLNKNNWNITKTSIDLGISRVTLYRKIRLYNINRKERI